MSSTVYIDPAYEQQCMGYEAHGGYIAAIVILIILVGVFVGLFIWAYNKEKNDPCTRLDIPDAVITASSTAINATWTPELIALEDKVTLYASSAPIKVNNDGTVNGVGTTVASISQTGSNSLSLAVGTSYTGVTIQKFLKYYVALVVTRSNNVHYYALNDIVFTQSQSDITGADKQFGIVSLIQNADIDEKGEYNANVTTDLWNFDGTYLTSIVDGATTDNVLCNVFGTLVVAQRDGDTITYNDNTLNKNSCTWKYNAEGFNRWCNATKDVVTGTRVCMVRNDESTVINVIPGNSSEFKWANYELFLDLEQP